MSSSGVETGAGAAARGRLTERQAETVARLVSTARDVLREQGYDGLTVRNVAAAAGVAPATAYTYFASKDHLIAEVFWRDLATVPPVERTDAREQVGSRLEWRGIVEHVDDGEVNLSPLVVRPGSRRVLIDRVHDGNSWASV